MISFQVEPYKSCLLFNKMFKGLCVSGRLREAVGLLCIVGAGAESGGVERGHLPPLTCPNFFNFFLCV